MLAATTAAYAAEVGRKLHPPAETKTEPVPNNAAAESKLLQGLSNTMYSLQANTLWSLYGAAAGLQQLLVLPKCTTLISAVGSWQRHYKSSAYKALY